MKKLLFIISLLPVLALAQSTDQNYIKTTTYKDSTATTSVVQMTYFDGLGRPVQQIAKGQASDNNDIVTPIKYDDYGRQPKEFLPYANTASSLNYNPNALTEQAAFYNTTAYENTPNPYSEKVFEASPLNRVLEQGAPGDAWSVTNSSKHTVRMDYQANVTADAVKLFQVTDSWNSSKGVYINSLTQSTTYPEGELYKTVTKDENWVTASGKNNTTEEFKDKEGKVILKRTYESATAHDTYYVYDDDGNLAYVLPPLAQGAFTTTVLDGLCYQYQYDYRNRMAAKKLPGKQWEYIVYDKLDRPVATGPTFSPFGDGTTGVMITEYDALGRVLKTGWRALTMTETARNTWQNDIIGGSNPFTLSTNDLLTQSYYDNYNAYPNTVPTTIEGQTVAANVKGMQTGSWTRVLTTPTGTERELNFTFYDSRYRPICSYHLNHLGGYTIVYSKLDFMGKTLYTKTYHQRSGSDALMLVKDSFTYSAQDRLTLHKQQINSLPEQLIVSNTYDKLGQLKTKKVGGTDATGAVGLQKVDYTYNIRGWLKSINDVANLTEGTNPQDLFAFKLNYQDNDTGGSLVVPSLYNGNISETFWRTSSDNVKRKYSYNYDNLNRLTAATYQKPDIATPVTNSYNESLSYDRNGNITQLSRTGEYDDNVYTLEIDNLAYSYNPNKPNQLMKVYDSTNNPKGFKDDLTDIGDQTDDYTYDANGNMVSDANKDITGIIYNHLNLPTKITFGSSATIEYLYNAAGVKLRKTAPEYMGEAIGYVVKVSDYQDGFQYKDNVLMFFPHAEGYVNNTVVNGNNVFNYVFNYTDHLGNIRLSYGIDPATSVLKVLEENNYYPFGLKHVNYNMTQKVYIKNGSGTAIESCPNCIKGYKYKYNGKELQDELGLNMYDYGSRLYDPARAGWSNIDPKAENSRRWSPYNYCYSNPLYFTDPDGMQAAPPDWYLNNATNNVMYRSGSEEIRGYTNLGSERTITYNCQDTYKLNSDGSFEQSNSNGNVTYGPGSSATVPSTGNTVMSPSEFNLSITNGFTIWGDDRAGTTDGHTGTTTDSMESSDIPTLGNGDGTAGSIFSKVDNILDQIIKFFEVVDAAGDTMDRVQGVVTQVEKVKEEANKKEENPASSQQTEYVRTYYNPKTNYQEWERKD